jgi:putative membrane protein
MTGDTRLKMSATWRKVLKGIGIVVIAVGLVVVGFVLGRNSLDVGGFFPSRYRFGALGLGFGLGGILSVVLTILFWAVIIGAVVWLVSSLFSRQTAGHPPISTPPSPESALDILKKRYGRGEITKTEYEDMHRDLGA